MWHVLPHLQTPLLAEAGVVRTIVTELSIEPLHQPGGCAQTVLSAALAAANLSGWLSGAGGAFTLFAVADGGWADAFARQDLLCTVAYMRTGACQTAGDLLSSTSLRRTLLGYGARPRRRLGGREVAESSGLGCRAVDALGAAHTGQ